MFAKPRPKKSPLPPPSKKRKASAVEEVTFDNTAREEYLNGFHKRKVQRQKHAQEEAAKRAREEKIEFRKQLREDRRKEVEEHVKSIEAILKENRVAGLDSDAEDAEGGSDKSGDEWDGIDDAAAAPATVLEPVDHEEEYIDEDLYTTVKVEAVSIDRDGLHNKAELEAADEVDEEKDRQKQQGPAAAAGGRKGKNDEPRKRKKKFRYESKLERSLTARKNKAKKARPAA